MFGKKKKKVYVPPSVRGPEGKLSDYSERGGAYEILGEPKEIPVSQYKTHPKDRLANNQACEDIGDTIGNTVAGSAIIAGIATIATGGILPLAAGAAYFLLRSGGNDEEDEE